MSWIPRVTSRAAVGAMAALAMLATRPALPAARQGCPSQPIIRLGGTTNGVHTELPALSADGRFVVFESAAPDLDGDTIKDIFVYDRQTCALEVVSVSSTGAKGNSDSRRPSISYDGRYVAFTSRAINLVASDTNSSIEDAFVRDRQLGVTSLVSVDSSGVQSPTQGASFARISGNGQVVAFVSRGTTLVPGDTNEDDDVFVRDLAAGTTERATVTTDEVQGENAPFSSFSDLVPVLSEDGRFVAYASFMINLVPNDNGSDRDVFVRDRVAGTTVRASVRSDGAEVDFMTQTGPAITADGRFVFFSSSTNLVLGEERCDGIFMRDLVLETTSCPFLDPLSTSLSQSAQHPSVSADGRFVAFTSSAQHYIPNNTTSQTHMWIHDRTTGATLRASANAFGIPANNFSQDAPALSANGQVMAFESTATNLVAPDNNGGIDVFVVVWSMLPSAPHVNFMRNGGFATSLQSWQTFATPDLSYIVTDMSAGELRFYREPPPPGTSNQAVVFQPTWAQVLAHAPLEARFRIGNSSTVRKRISVLVHDADFSDLSVCTFWLEPNAPLRNYMMRTHTTEFWSNATISFYAATAGADGGFYRVDDVSLFYEPILDDDVTDCIDPTAPAAPGGAAGPSLLGNGDFAAGLAPWATFGQITSQITNAVFEFVRPPGTPAGVVLQPTGMLLAQHDILTALFYLGNSSSVRKRVTLILHDQDFSDLSACTFWLAPGQPLSPYVVRTFATKAWANATFSLYPATVGLDEWIRFTDATLQVTPGTTPLGTECLEPGAESILAESRGLPRPSASTRTTPSSVPAGSTGFTEPALTGIGSGSRAIWQGDVDLGSLSDPVLSFQSSLGDDSLGIVQISLDGSEWTTLLVAPDQPGWTSVDVDLSSVTGRTVSIRLVYQGRATAGFWQVRHIRVRGRQR